MSFILDALRKSEHERERHVVPGRFEPPRSREASPRLRWIVGGLTALLLVNLAIVSWLVLRPEPAREPQAVVAPVVTRLATPDATALPVPAERHIRSLAAETQPAEPSIDYPEPVITAPGTAAGAPRAASRPLRDTARHPSSALAGLPTINELPATATAGLPRLNIDLLVFNSDPAQRFAIINGQKLRDGGQMKEGPTVEQITAEGAVLVHQGTRFLLPAN